jgi:hypothetical protein
VYNGQYGRELATHLVAGCSCGWRGARTHPIDWVAVEASGSVDTSGPHEDWWSHVDGVDSQVVPIPEGIQELLDRISTNLDDLAIAEPLAALRAASGLDRLAKRVSSTAARHVRGGEDGWSGIAKALGLTEDDARSRLREYSRGR